MEKWADLHLRDLFWAFRKAKADRFYETSVRVAEQFVEYEQNLAANLESLLFRLKNGEIAKLIQEYPGEVVVLPKKTAFEKAARMHSYQSNSARAQALWAAGSVRAEFRFIGAFSVEVHVIAALWINLVGHKFDAVLSDHAVASRLRRYGPNGRENLGKYHLESIGSFEPYFGPYQNWRDNGIEAIRSTVEKGDAVAALTLDVSNFYHSIDPRFAISRSFLADAGIELSDFELGFTNDMIRSLIGWNSKCRDQMRKHGCAITETDPTGLPIGLSVSRLLANVILFELDRQIVTNLSPIYYSRYVDDIFLVLYDRSNFLKQEDLWKFIEEKVIGIKGDINSKNHEFVLPDWGGRTKIQFHPKKQKAFFLDGKAGLDLLENVSEQIRELSSERRLMPSVDDLHTLSSAKVLSSNATADEDVDALRKADGLTLRRLGWSVLLRSLSVLSRDLDAEEWVEERNEVYRFAHDHVIRAEKILEYLDKIPWLFSVAVSLKDWAAARGILFETRAALRQIESASHEGDFWVNGMKCTSGAETLWQNVQSSVTLFFREAFIRSHQHDESDERSRSFANILFDLNIEDIDVAKLASQAGAADWGRIPYRVLVQSEGEISLHEGEHLLHSLYPRTSDLIEFLDLSSELEGSASRITGVTNVERSLVPYLFPTRPYSPQEIALYAPNQCVFGDPISAASNWAKFVRAVRGIWTKNADYEDMRLPLAASSGSKVAIPKEADLGGRRDNGRVLLGISSFEIRPETWDIGANGSNDHSAERYQRLRGIVNQAMTAKPRPDYFLLPELAIPERWIFTVSSLLAQAKISLISGVDYSYPDANSIHSSAVLVLKDERLGYSSTIQVRQMKQKPAPGEEKSLLERFNRSWFDFGDNQGKALYHHGDFSFGVLVCSELQNMEYRKQFQGDVDCLFIVSWNKDLETFSALVEGAALDVHGYIALVNNRAHGDSRVRAPFKASYLRDICRLKGGLNDHLAVVEIDIAALRRHQSRAKRWPRPNDRFKPVPEGFSISDRRCTIPD